jgi:cytochrome c-type biogenesis protein
MENVNFLTSFIAGLVMFLAPCTLPLVPGFIAFISHGEKNRTVKNAFLFCLGFLITFIVFGLLAGVLGKFLLPYKLIVQKVGAVFVIVLALYMLGLFNLSLFQNANAGNFLHKIFKGKFTPFIFGVSVALGWSPCVGPVLAGIFFYATFSYSVFQALWLFLFFSLGFIVPFMAVAFLVRNSKREVFLKSFKGIEIIAGLLLLFIGLLLLTDNFSLLAGWFYKFFGFINYEGINNLL